MMSLESFLFFLLLMLVPYGFAMPSCTFVVQLETNQPNLKAKRSIIILVLIPLSLSLSKNSNANSIYPKFRLPVLKLEHLLPTNIEYVPNSVRQVFHRVHLTLGLLSRLVLLLGLSLHGISKTVKQKVDISRLIKEYFQTNEVIKRSVSIDSINQIDGLF